MKALKRVKPQVLVSAKTQGGIQGMSKGNYTTEGSFADSNLNEVIPLFTGKVPAEVVKDGCTDCMYCVGRCMEPTIRYGGVVGFDFYDRKLIENELYIFELEGWKPVIQLKRLFRVLPGRG